MSTGVFAQFVFIAVAVVFGLAIGPVITDAITGMDYSTSSTPSLGACPNTNAIPNCTAVKAMVDLVPLLYYGGVLIIPSYLLFTKVRNGMGSRKG